MVKETRDTHFKCPATSLLLQGPSWRHSLPCRVHSSVEGGNLEGLGVGETGRDQGQGRVGLSAANGLLAQTPHWMGPRDTELSQETGILLWVPQKQGHQ